MTREQHNELYLYVARNASTDPSAEKVLQCPHEIDRLRATVLALTGVVDYDPELAAAHIEDTNNE